MAYLSMFVTLALALACIFLAPCSSRQIVSKGYITVGLCDEVCHLHPETTCKLDCMVVPNDDCINHHYYSNGTIEHHCDWD